MHTIKRSVKDVKKGKELFTIGLDNIAYITIQNARDVLENTSLSLKEIRKRVDKSEIRRQLSYVKTTQQISQNDILTFKGFAQLVETMSHSDKKQNGEQALELMKEVQEEINEYVRVNYSRDEIDENVNHINKTDVIKVMDANGFSKEKWIKLYVIFSNKHNISNVYNEARIVTGSSLLKGGILDYVEYKYPHLMSSLYEIAKTL